MKATLTKIGLTDFDVLVYLFSLTIFFSQRFFVDFCRPYIEGIVSDDTVSRDEKLSSLEEFLSMAKVSYSSTNDIMRMTLHRVVL